MQHAHLVARGSHCICAQRGQSLMFGMLAASAASIVLVMLYNVGQVALARSRLTQATDAAAYTGALVQARTLNMLAHVQRAQVGHQVAMAHLVTLGAWSQFSHEERARYRWGNPPSMIINRFFGSAHRLGYARARSMQVGTEQALTQAMAGHDRTAHRVLAQVARQLVTGLPGVRAAAIQQVLDSNIAKPTARASRSIQWSIHHDTWQSLLVKRSSQESRAARSLGEMVRRAVEPYAFLRKRHHSKYSPWSIHPACPWMLHNLQRRGATWLDESGRWGAMDTQSFHARRFNRYIGCYYREYIMGGGAVRGDWANPDGLTEDDLPDLSKEAFWRWARRATRWDIRIAESRMAGLVTMLLAWAPPQRGLPPWYDVQEASIGKADFELEVSQSMSAVPTSDQPHSPFGPVGQFAFAGLGRAARMVVRAAGQTYFSPQRDSEGTSTFRPQWRARLAPVRREGGQALLESIVVMTLLLIFAGAALNMGEGFQASIQDDQTSRWLAFTLPSVSSTLPSVASAPASESLSAQRAPALRMAPGGRGQAASEMRAAWHYDDPGLVSVRAGARTTTVARDAGHHNDHRATQRRIGRSDTAWSGAVRVSQRVGTRIRDQAGAVDTGWHRAQPSFDWLMPWAKIDLGKNRRRQRSCPTGGVGRRRRRLRSGEGAVRLILLGLGTLLLWAPAQAAPAPCERLWCAVGVDASVECSAPAMRLADELKRLKRALAAIPAGDQAQPVQAWLWFGIPVAMRPFAFNLPRSITAFTGPVPGLSVAARLTAAQPDFRDFAVVGDIYMLSGHVGGMQWLAQWQEGASGVTGVMSLLRLGAPLYEVRAPAWMGRGATPVTHMVFPAEAPTAQVTSHSRSSDTSSSAGLHGSSVSVWKSVLAPHIMIDQMAAAYAKQGWQRVGAASATTARWRRGHCLVDARVSAELDPAQSRGTHIYLHSVEDTP